MLQPFVFARLIRLQKRRTSNTQISVAPVDERSTLTMYGDQITHTFPINNLSLSLSLPTNVLYIPRFWPPAPSPTLYIPNSGLQDPDPPCTYPGSGLQHPHPPCTYPDLASSTLTHPAHTLVLASSTAVLRPRPSSSGFSSSSDDSSSSELSSLKQTITSYFSFPTSLVKTKYQLMKRPKNVCTFSIIPTLLIFFFSVVICATGAPYNDVVTRIHTILLFVGTSIGFRFTCFPLPPTPQTAHHTSL